MRPRLIAGIVVAAFALVMVVVYKFPPSQYSFYPRCPFYAATHLLCPGCGATRALHALLHGDPGAALHYNAMFSLLAPFLLGWLVFCCYQALRHDRLPRLRISPPAIAGFGLAALLFAIGRNTLFTL
ncbi:MAG TPA: DUF2752 domain-containing protein [Candidatus Sulfotelmatobacter sp.]|nr:DUF2752 domain-containing protein [Candidatus Sulfotelmatobacter sp.]